MDDSGSIYRQHYEQMAQTDGAEQTDAQLHEALRRLGIGSVAGELNCGSCGQKTCMSFAEALLAGRAKPDQCIVYQLKLARQKAESLLQRMPTAALMADAQLRLVACNQPFVQLFAPEAGSPKALEGRPLDELLPFAHLFERVLASGEPLLGHDLRHQRYSLRASLFVIESNALICGILQQFTEPEFEREQILARAREVTQKHLKTVQQIAFLLGENAAEAEILLDTITRAYAPGTDADEDSGDDRLR